MMNKEMGATRAAQIVAVMLVMTVVLQIYYMVTLGGPATMTPDDVVAYFTDRWGEVAAVWTLEAVAFAGIALGALVAMVHGAGNRIAWAAIALSGVFNLVQIGIGLSLFRPLALAEEALFPLFGTVVGAAFFFYFLAKALLGFAGLVLGIVLLQGSTATAAKVVGGITAFLGLVALLANVIGINQGMGWVLYGGASGTLVAIFVAIAGNMAAKRSES